MNNTYLIHHGILGQKWGVRRYQNPDGTLTEEGRKRLGYDLQKEAKKTYSSAQPYRRSEEYKNMIGKALENNHTITDADRLTLREKRDEYRKVLNEYLDSDYYESGQHIVDSQKAYEETVKYFKKNEPDYYKEILKLNGGKDDGTLDGFHDFRKTYEGYLGEFWTNGEKEWDKTHDSKRLEQKLKDVEEKYKAECKRVGDKLIGKYGDVEVTKASKYISSTTINDDIASYIDSLMFAELHNF